MDDIEHQLQDVLKILANNLSSYEKGRQPHSPKGEEEEKEEEEEEEGDDESGSDTPSSSEEEEDGEEGGSSPDEEEKNGHQSHHRRGLTPPITVNRPVMARNAGMSRSSNVRTAGLNNVRKQTRYPRLLKKKVVNLETIEEIQDELIHEAVSRECGVWETMKRVCSARVGWSRSATAQQCHICHCMLHNSPSIKKPTHCPFIHPPPIRTKQVKHRDAITTTTHTHTHEEEDPYHSLSS